MKQEDFFGKALWIEADDVNAYPAIFKNFTYKKQDTPVILTILGLGTFTMYLNGVRVGEDYQLPLNSDFETRPFPVGETTRHRVYPVQYDITPYLKEGENVFAVLLGCYWYTGTKNEVPFGTKKLIYQIQFGEENIVTDGSEEWLPSFVTDNHRYEEEEHHDYTIWSDDYLLGQYKNARKVVPARPLQDTTYEKTNCPYDAIAALLSFKQVAGSGTDVLYDATINTSGYPVLVANEPGLITVTYAEELNADGYLDEKNTHHQKTTYLADKAGRICFPEFTFFGYRYFRVEGNASVKEVRRIHSNIAITSSFESDSEVLNWLYKTYIDTQLCNMHAGIPSDCPHIERRGYTGDGELTCHAAMLQLDTHDFYQKWIKDIGDCQDLASGHVQYTAPYTRCGGGPGGWGCAIVEVPYQYYLHYGDDSYLREYFSQMLLYFKFLEGHNANGFVISDIPGAWCLGEWCTPDPKQVIVPAPFVNNYFYIRSMQRVLEIARIIGVEETYANEIQLIQERLEYRKQVTTNAYLNVFDGNFFGNAQGANAFALDIGLGDELTKNNFITYYKTHPFYDTGIFGTEIVTRLLFQYGETQTAVRLITQDTPHGFGRWKNLGATSFWEYWYVARSHNHPMFGAVTANLFEYLLGIQQTKDSVGYKELRIQPQTEHELKHLSGSVTLPTGKVAVSVEKAGEKVEFTITLENAVKAVFAYQNKEIELHRGTQVLVF